MTAPARPPSRPKARARAKLIPMTHLPHLPRFVSRSKKPRRPRLPARSAGTCRGGRGDVEPQKAVRPPPTAAARCLTEYSPKALGRAAGCCNAFGMPECLEWPGFPGLLCSASHSFPRRRLGLQQKHYLSPPLLVGEDDPISRPALRRNHQEQAVVPAVPFDLIQPPPPLGRHCFKSDREFLHVDLRRL